MLASFESFLETAKLKSTDEEQSNFDDADQTSDSLEKEGIDVGDVNRLANDYGRRLAGKMPHPKMDALVDALKDNWTQGRKALVFVRRVASVKELKRKLDERYDDWIIKRMRDGLPETMHDRLAQIFAQYQREKSLHDALRNQETSAQSDEESDQGGIDTFFAWFFRGEGPRGVVSGANIQQRFIQRGAAYAPFLQRIMLLLCWVCMPEHVTDTLLNYLNVSIDELRHELRKRSQRYLSSAKRHSRADRFEAVKQLRLSG